MKEFIQEVLNEKKTILEKLDNNDFTENISKSAGKIIDAIKSGHKIMIAGNGGSAADSQHFAAELVGRFEVERKGIPAIALTTDTSIITSVGNDYCFNNIFSRQIEAFANQGDVFIGISTSGNSENIFDAVKLAKNEKVFTIGLLGKDGGKLKELCDLSVVVPSDTTARIQEVHEMCIHIICSLVDQEYK